MSHNPIVQMDNHTVGNWYLFSKVELVEDQYEASVRIHHQSMRPEEYVNEFKENKLFSTNKYTIRHNSIYTKYDTEFDRARFSASGITFIRMTSDITYILNFLAYYRATSLKS